MKKRIFVQTAAAMMAGAALCLTAAAQDAFPGKPIRFVIPSAPAGVSDVVARAYGERMSKSLKFNPERATSFTNRS